MYCVEMRETYQRTLTNRVQMNFDTSRYFKDFNEVKQNIESLQQELEQMDIVQVKTFRESNKVARRIEYHRPGKLGTLVRTIVVRRYNPPKQVELI